MDGPDRLPPPRLASFATMRRFDALPVDVRRVIACAAFQFHPQAAEKLLARGVAGPRCAVILKRNDARISARVWGAK